MEITKATGCAWRGVYIDDDHGRQLARAIVDPNGGVRPTLTLAVAIGRDEHRNRLHPRLAAVRIPLPYVGWRYPMGRIRRACYRISQRFWRGIDGRHK